MRMRSVVVLVKLTVRLTRLLPLTVPSVTQETPFLHGEGGDAVLAEGHGLGRLDRTGVVVLEGIDDDVIDGLAAVEVDLDPVGIAIGRSVVPTAAITPI